MKKLLLIVLAYLLLTSVTVAQYYQAPSGTGNPNNVNQEDLEYPYGGGLPAGWNVVHSGNTTNAQWSTAQALPFSFQFNGSTVTSYKVSTSGVLTFTTSATSVPSSVNYALPHNAIPAASICVWGLSGKGSNDYIMSKTFGTAPNRQHWVTFTAYSLPAIVTNHYTYWSIVLEEGTNAIYLVDQRTSPGISTALTLGIQIASGDALMVSGSPAVANQAGDNPSRADNHFYTFLPGTQPARDLDGQSVLLDEYLTVTNGPYEIKLIVQNLGSDTVTQVDINYLNSGNLKTTATLTNLNILPWAIDTLTHPQAWAPQAGSTIFKAWAENINGLPDENFSNDTAFKAITVLQNAAVRIPLLETFTSSTSVPSKTFNDQFENTISQFAGDVVHLKYPMNWPGTGDPYFTNEGGIRRQYYGVSTLPNLQVDGTDWITFNTIFDQNVLSSAQNKMALIDLDADFYYNGKTVCANISLEPLVDLPNTSLTLYAAIYERETTQNVKTNGETSFYHVMKKMLPNANGTSITNLQAGNTDQFNLCYTFNGNYVLPPNATQPVNLSTSHTIEEFSDLGVAVWIQNDQTKEVYQAVDALNVIGIDEVSITNEIKLYPNPAEDEVFIALHLATPQTLRISMHTLTGQEILELETKEDQGKIIVPVALPNLPTGAYLMSISVGDNVTVQKLLIR